MTRGRAWTPPRRAAHDHGPISPALVPNQPGNTNGHAFSGNPRDHIAIYRPRCTLTGCREPGMVWSRCRCGQAFARCYLHNCDHPVEAARAAHRCPETV